ncbi:MAG: aspartate aminotransferase family protein [Sneathiellaceae bacterium]
MDSGSDFIFHRKIGRTYPVAAGGSGAEIVGEDGRQYLDAAGGVFVAIVGHGVSEIAEAISEQLRSLNFAYTGDFTTSAEQRLAEKLIAIAPPGFAKVWLTTSGSTANEAALKLARQYHHLRGASQKSKIVSRWHSYHGSTMGALSMSGAVPRRQLYTPYLIDFPHVAAPNCYRCPLGRSPADCDTACAEEIGATMRLHGADYISAFIVEPVAGGPLGALPTTPAYLQAARRFCDENDALLIVDEVVSGVGRTGDWFGVQESGVVPDIITLGKGLGGGYTPIGAVLVHERVHAAFESSGTPFLHGESFTGHSTMAAAGYATLSYIERHGLLGRVREMGERLAGRMQELSNLPIVGDVRGRGLLQGIELVRDRRSNAPFARAAQVAERVVAAAAERGVLLLAGNAGVDGVDGDTVVVAPPYIVSAEQVDRIVDTLSDALRTVPADSEA